MKILFVCLGNICRSAAAEAVMSKLLEIYNIDDWVVDSAGTSAYHQGEQADPRMIEAALKRGYAVTSVSRQMKCEDGGRFDWIITMDEQNFSDVATLLPALYQSKLHRFVAFCDHHKVANVPDPYYGGAQGFDEVLDILEDGCEGLFQTIKKTCHL